MGREGDTPAKKIWHIGVKKKWYKLSKFWGGGVEVIWTKSKRTATFFSGDRPCLHYLLTYISISLRVSVVVEWVGTDQRIIPLLNLLSIIKLPILFLFRAVQLFSVLFVLGKSGAPVFCPDRPIPGRQIEKGLVHDAERMFCFETL